MVDKNTYVNFNVEVICNGAEVLDIIITDIKSRAEKEEWHKPNIFCSNKTGKIWKDDN